MAKTAKPGLLLVVLAGMVAGLWIAAHTGVGEPEAGGSNPAGMVPDGADGAGAPDGTDSAGEMA